MRKRAKKTRNKCPQCLKIFVGRKNRKFCSSKCRFKDWAIKNPRVNIEEIKNEQEIKRIIK